MVYFSFVYFVVYKSTSPPKCIQLLNSDTLHAEVFWGKMYKCTTWFLPVILKCISIMYYRCKCIQLHRWICDKANIQILIIGSRMSVYECSLHTLNIYIYLKFLIKLLERFRCAQIIDNCLRCLFQHRHSPWQFYSSNQNNHSNFIRNDLPQNWFSNFIIMASEMNDFR